MPLRFAADRHKLRTDVRRYSILSTVLLIASSVAFAGKADQVLVVKIQGYDGEHSHDVKTHDELKALQQEFRDEARLFGKAYRLADKRWKAETGKPRFTRSAVSVRRATIIGRPYNNAERAHDKIMDIETRIGDRLIAEREKEKKRNRRLKKSKLTLAKERRRDREREADLEQARNFFLKILEELKNPPPPGDE